MNLIKVFRRRLMSPRDRLIEDLEEYIKEYSKNRSARWTIAHDMELRTLRQALHILKSRK